MNVVWTPLAEERVREFVRSMRADRTGAAWRWLQGLLARLRGLTRCPQSGRAIPELQLSPDGTTASTTIGEIYFDPCRVIYRIEKRRLVILTVRSAGAHRKSARYAERSRGSRPAARGRS